LFLINPDQNQSLCYFVLFAFSFDDGNRNTNGSKNGRSGEWKGYKNNQTLYSMIVQSSPGQQVTFI
jgi:hypothetical protein